MKLGIRAARILDFDIESRPLSYLGSDWTTGEITAIAASFGPSEHMYCWLLGIHQPEEILDNFRRLYNEADIVTGHFIRKFDLPYINGAMLEYGRPPLAPKLVQDTKVDLIKSRSFSMSQESISGTISLPEPKKHMTQPMWREANRLHKLNLTRERVEGDVRQHMAMRKELLRLNMLGGPRMWYPV